MGIGNQGGGGGQQSSGGSPLGTAIGGASAQGAWNMLSGFMQNKYQRGLMDDQYKYNRKMLRYGKDLDYEMWLKTNYGAQVDQLKQAGLNPGLMYGMSGGGGVTTGSQTGQGVSQGQASMMAPMDVASLMKLKAEIENINSQTGVNEATEKDIRETLPGDITKLDEEANNLVASTNELGSREMLNIANEGLAKANMKVAGKQEQKIDAEILKIVKDKELVQKIITMDYSEEYGRNQMLNLIKMMNLTPDEGGGLGLDDAGKLAVVAGSIYLLRANLTRTGLKQGYNAVKGKLNQAWNWVKRKRAGSLVQRYKN